MRKTRPAAAIPPRRSRPSRLRTATGRRWSTATPEGGFLMGNPNADVKLVELGSMTCPHCAEFAEQADQKLINDYVKSGRVSFEFRNFVRDRSRHDRLAHRPLRRHRALLPADPGSLRRPAQLGAKLQEVPQEQLQALQTMGPERQFVEFAKLVRPAAMGGAARSAVRQEQHVPGQSGRDQQARADQWRRRGPVPRIHGHAVVRAQRPIAQADRRTGIRWSRSCAKQLGS